MLYGSKVFVSKLQSDNSQISYNTGLDMLLAEAVRACCWVYTLIYNKMKCTF